MTNPNSWFMIIGGTMLGSFLLMRSLLKTSTPPSLASQFDAKTLAPQAIYTAIESYNHEDYTTGGRTSLRSRPRASRGSSQSGGK